MKTQGTIFLLCAAVLLTISCKKNSDDKKATCKIVTVSQTSSGTTSTINITYNNDGKISTLNSTGSGASSKVFTYSGNTIIINTTAGSSSSRDSITVDARNKPLNIRQFSDLTGNNWTNYSFEYNGDDLLKFHQTDNDGSPAVTSTATYQNGNMVSLQSGGSTSTLEYFTDKKAQPGDYLELVSLIQYGVNVYPHKNLLKSINSGGSSINNFNYEFDAQGNITKVTATSGSSTTTLTYQYQCN